MQNQERVLFEAAVQIADPSERAAFLDRSCQQDSKLRTRLDALISSHQKGDPFLEVPAIDFWNRRAEHSDLPTSMPQDAAAVDPSDADLENKSPSNDSAIPDLGFLDPSNEPGSLGVLGHYQIRDVIGQGAFGIVLKAFDQKLHRFVAIKVLSPHLAATSPPRKRFLREARSAAAINHENVVRVYSVEEQPIPYLVMEFIEGITLQHKLDGAGPLDVHEILHIGRQIASGLAAAHGLRLIHRDIKPANIMLDSVGQGRVKITDFGLARTTDDASLTRSGMISGTPSYMSPEQAEGAPLDERADLFSLGSVLYVMAAGRPPFRAPSAIAILRRVAEDTPRPIQEIVPEIPQTLCDLIANLHAKKAQERIPSAEKVEELLGLCQAQLRQTGRLEIMLPGLDQAASARMEKNENCEEVPAPHHPQQSTRPVAGSGAQSPANRRPWVAAGFAGLISIAGVCLAILPNFRNSRLTETFDAATRPGTEFPSHPPAPPTVEPPDSQREVPGNGATNTGPSTRGYFSLFNGQDLTGWEQLGNANAEWRIQDGILFSQWRNSNTSGGAYLCSTKNNYQNFRFRIETTLGENGTGSLIFALPRRFPRAGSYRVNIGGGTGKDAAETGNLYQEGKNERLAAPGTPLKFAKNEWFTLEVVVRGKNIRAWVNNVPRTHLELAEIPKPGYLGIGITGGALIRIRKIEVEELPFFRDQKSAKSQEKAKK